MQISIGSMNLFRIFRYVHGPNNSESVPASEEEIEQKAYLALFYPEAIFALACITLKSPLISI